MGIWQHDAAARCGVWPRYARASPAISGARHPLHLRVPARQRRRRAGAVFRREGSADHRCNVIVENRSGAGGNIAIEYVARAKPDGYTVFVHAASGTAASMSLFKNPPVDVAKTIQVVATINRQPFMVVVDAKSPHKTLADLTAAMKQKGDKASYATAAPFGNGHGRNLQARHRRAGGRSPYKTAIDSLNDQLSGAIDYAVHDPVYALAEQRKGDLRILAVEHRRAAQGQPRLADHDGTRASRWT